MHKSKKGKHRQSVFTGDIIFYKTKSAKNSPHSTIIQ